MPQVARVGDTAVGTCTCHQSPQPWTGTIITGAGTVMAENMQVARVGDMAMACHPGTIASGSGTVMAEGASVARVGDTVVSGCVTATIVTGAGTVMAGG